jgi:hypothetical protein
VWHHSSVKVTGGQDLKAPRVLEPKVSSNLLQPSSSRSRGKLQRCYMFTMSRPMCNHVYRIVFQFCVCFFCIFLPPCGQLLSLCPASSLSCAILSQADLLEVHVTYLGSLSYFLARGPMLSNDCSLKKLMLNEESRAYILLSLVLYPKHVYFVSLMLTTEYSGSRRCMPLNKAITII